MSKFKIGDRVIILPRGGPSSILDWKTAVVTSNLRRAFVYNDYLSHRGTRRSWQDVHSLQVDDIPATVQSLGPCEEPRYLLKIEDPDAEAIAQILQQERTKIVENLGLMGVRL